MLWLERPPLLRWFGAACLVAVAIWSELAPPPATTATFATAAIAAGAPVTADLIETRRVESLSLSPVEPGGVAAVDVAAGGLLIPALVRDFAVPRGWMLISAPIPDHALSGHQAVAVVIGQDGPPAEFPAIVVETAGSDPFEDTGGTLAVPAEWMGVAVEAVAEGRLAVGVDASGG